MSRGLIAGLIVAGVVVLLAVVMISWYFSITNGEVRLANRYEAQFNVRETTLDTMRKVLMNQYTVTKEFADNFIAVVAMQSKGREGGTLFKSSTESQSLGISPDMYKSMLASIQGQLEEFKRSQDTLTDIWREHTTYCQTAPNSWFVGGKVKPRPEMVSSDAAKEAIKTHRLNDNVLEQK